MVLSSAKLTPRKENLHTRYHKFDRRVEIVSVCLTEQMQNDQHQSLQNTRIPHADPPIAPFVGQNVDFQPLKICPRNFIIFDRTDNRSQIMYHPGFGYPGVNVVDNMLMRNDTDDPPFVMKEDSADIDMLLSFEEEDECDEDEVSTARTHGNNHECDTADSCSSRRTRNSRLGLSLDSHKSSGSGERKREKMRKMVKSLRGIVPGGNQMSTVAVLDEAVKYLKSLKVELQKVGDGGLKN